MRAIEGLRVNHTSTHDASTSRTLCQRRVAKAMCARTATEADIDGSGTVVVEDVEDNVTFQLKLGGRHAH